MPPDDCRSAVDEVLYFEFTTVGGTVKVTAIDGPTGREASIVAPCGMTRPMLGKLALRKLAYVLKRFTREPLL